MFQRMKAGFLRHIYSLRQEQENRPSPHKMQIHGLQYFVSASIGCETTSDVTAKKSRALPEEESLYDEEVLREVLEKDYVDLDELRSFCRRGCPAAFRYEVWGYLTGHLHPFRSNRTAVLARKRQEYVGYVHSSYDGVDWDTAFRASESDMCTRVPVVDTTIKVDMGEGLTAPISGSQNHKKSGDMTFGVVGESELRILKQIRKDVPRMSAGVAYLLHPRVMLSIERTLYIWSLRHPACGYVQGINDLIIPFLSVVLANRVCASKTVAELHSIPESDLDVFLSTEAFSEENWLCTIEADIYWMFAHLLGAVQENYTYNQKGVYSMVEKLEKVILVVDAKLHRHLREYLQIDFSQFAFRWMNCLLLRELNATQSLRLWDVYLGDEEKEWTTTHVYICAALLQWWSPALCRERDYGVAMKFLQNLPTEELNNRSIGTLISQGIMMQKLYNNTLGHLVHQ